MSLRIKVRNRLRCGRLVAASVPSSSERKAWVGVLPFKEVPLMERPSGYDHLPFKYRIMKFEIEKEVLEQGYDIGPHEMLDYKDVVVDSEAEMEKILLEWVGELEQLDAPWYSDYPL